jgi:ribonuclease HI
MPTEPGEYTYFCTLHPFLLFGADLNEQITGEDPTTGNSVTLNGNINALILLNGRRQPIELDGDNSVALDSILRR